MARRRACIERCCALIVFFCLTMTGCATPSSKTPLAKEAPRSAEVANDDPMTAALLWTSAKTAMNDQELETIVTSWEHPQVLRVFRDGGVYRAVVADGPQDELRQAAILTIDRVEGLWAVTHVESGRSDLLWPGY